ncbi:SDR family NAD(P)-dependent oxidoreductase [Porphyromonas levii]|uniref:SDR family NAD(P)-dependent oxidoreductase n=1 Tax=Porphyromonas levii TaxID=28114 RepID=UPI001BAA36D9|nr:SDR family oxidoreductase [Porphyromonas levii]MBR8772976.1 3-alpha-hydroxycholanate dehydrogenase (NADP(+)) [Porphyromonas levii]MBR8802449.1 3-alpha-hydroxycholanate dehydrogenase (NADP(+)) [Porphyromonas levii]
MGHKVLVTGGSKGIGLAAVEAMAKRGDVEEIFLTYNSDAERALEVLEQLGATYDDVTFHLCQLDVTDAQEGEALEDALEQLDFVPTVVCFNANVTNRSPLEELDMEEWRRLFQANVHFPVEMTKRLAPKMVEGGVFLFTGSMMAIQPHSVSLGYGVSKSAVHALVTNLVKHLEPYGHRVVGIAPGFVDTEWQKTKPAEIRANIEAKVALHRFATPAEVGSLFAYVLDNAYFNGDILTLSGGYSYK